MIFPFNYKIWLLTNQFEIMQLTELQRICWQNLGYESTATSKIRNTALKYYLQYRQHLKETHSFIENESKIQNLFLISYFISEKAQLVYDINGKRISNIAFSINQLAKRHSDYKDFFFHLKQMMRRISLPAQATQSQSQINAFMKYFSFVMTFYNKFLTTFDKITVCHNIQEKDLQFLGGQTQYKDKIKYLLWVMYISFRKVFFKNNMDTIGSTCLLACLYTYFIAEIYKQERITSLYAPQIVQDLGTFPNIFEQIEEILLKFFCLKDLNTYEQIRKVFLEFIKNLSSKFPQLKQPFSPKTILMNIKKVQQVYHRNMEMSHIDETLFLKNLISNQQNVRFTAFGAKRKIAKYHSNNVVQCRRALNYEAEMKNNETATSVKKNCSQSNESTSASSYLDVIHKIKASQTPVILIQATPVNQFTLAYNWLFNKSLLHGQNQVGLNLEDLLQIGYKNDEYQLGNEEIMHKKRLIEGLFYELLKQYPQQSQQNINVCTILALQVFYYVMNITNRQLTELVRTLNVSWYLIWQGVDKLLNYDRTMPNNVKTHLLLLETSIVSSFIWKQTQFVDSLDQNDICLSYKNFFFRVLHHIAYQIHFIGKNVDIPDVIMDQVFILSQYYLKEFSYLMKNMNLDVIIMCSIYGVCRAKNLDIKFKTIMSAFKSVNNMDQKAFQSIDAFQNEQGQTFTIILYYNKVFLKYSKSILMKIKEEKLQDDQVINSTRYVLSPVKSILPAGLLLRGNLQVTPGANQMLYAYNESPLLKKNKKINLNHKTSNKENLQGVNQHRKKLYNQSQVLRDRSNNVSQMIQKKFGNKKTSTLIPKGHHLKLV